MKAVLAARKRISAVITATSANPGVKLLNTVCATCAMTGSESTTSRPVDGSTRWLPWSGSANLASVMKANAVTPPNIVIATTPSASRVRAAFSPLGFLNSRHPVADRLDPGERGTAGREGAQQQEHQREPADAHLLAADLEVGGLGLEFGPGEQPQHAPQQHAADREHEQVGRDGEGDPGLLEPAQVAEGQQHQDHQRDRDLVRLEELQQGADVLDTGRDRHRDGQDVVDQQRAGDEHAPVGAEVLGGDLEVAAAALVGPDVLPVGGDDGEEDHHDGRGHPRGVLVHDEPFGPEGQQDLLGRVRHRRQRVAGEHGQRDALGEKLLVLLGAAQSASQKHPLHKVRSL